MKKDIDKYIIFNLLLILSILMLISNLMNINYTIMSNVYEDIKYIMWFLFMTGPGFIVLRLIYKMIK
jgi:hypothetical protein